MATFQLACPQKEVRLGRESICCMASESQRLFSGIWLSWLTAIWISKLIFIITLCLTISKKSSFIYRNLKGFTCLLKEQGQTGWVGVNENRNRFQGFTEYFSFHCLSSFVVVVTVVAFTFFFFFKTNICTHRLHLFVCY